MVLLKQVPEPPNLMVLGTFTFHYGLIKTKTKDAKIFIEEQPLHSTMVLLKLSIILLRLAFLLSLHSTMVLLKHHLCVSALQF